MIQPHQSCVRRSGCISDDQEIPHVSWLHAPKSIGQPCNLAPRGSTAGARDLYPKCTYNAVAVRPIAQEIRRVSWLHAPKTFGTLANLAPTSLRGAEHLSRRCIFCIWVTMRIITSSNAHWNGDSWLWGERQHISPLPRHRRNPPSVRPGSKGSQLHLKCPKLFTRFWNGLWLSGSYGSSVVGGRTRCLHGAPTGARCSPLSTVRDRALSGVEKGGHVDKRSFPGFSLRRRSPLSAPTSHAFTRRPALSSLRSPQERCPTGAETRWGSTTRLDRAVRGVS